MVRTKQRWENIGQIGWIRVGLNSQKEEIAKECSIRLDFCYFHQTRIQELVDMVCASATAVTTETIRRSFTATGVFGNDVAIDKSLYCETLTRIISTESGWMTKAIAREIDDSDKEVVSSDEENADEE